MRLAKSGVCGVFVAGPLALVSPLTASTLGMEPPPPVARQPAEPPRPLLFGPADGEQVAVYPPSVRLALAAHQALLRGEEFDLSTASEWLVSPLVYFVFRWPCVADGPACVDPSAPDVAFTPDDFPLAVIVPNGHLPSSSEQRPAEWVGNDLLELDEVGGSPFAGAAAVAAFKPEHLRDGWTVVAYWTKGRAQLRSEGILTPDILAALQ